MIAIDLPPSVLSRDARIDLSTIENLMLWPKDEGARDAAFRAAAVEDTVLNYPLKAIVDRDSFTAIARSRPLSDIQEKIGSRFQGGLVAGYRLWYLLCKINSNPRISFRRLDPIICKEFGISVSTINNTIWPDFKSVAHFWAASIAISSTDNNPAFPCNRPALPMFLSFAEQIRVMAATTKAYGTSRFIVDENVAVSIAPDWLPRTKLQWDGGEMYLTRVL